MYFLRFHETITITGDPSETHQNPIRDPLEIPMSDRRPTWCLIEDPSETNIPDRITIEDRRLGQACPMGLRWGMLVFDETFGLRWGMLVADEAYWSSMMHVRLWWGMWSPMRDVGLWWGMSVSDDTCQSMMRHVGFRLDMSISNKSSMGLRNIINSFCAYLLFEFYWWKLSSLLN